MNRRSFLALLASAPIAALAPWNTMLASQTLYYAPAVTGGPVGQALYGPVYRSGDVAVDMPAEAARLRYALANAFDPD